MLITVFHRDTGRLPGSLIEGLPRGGLSHPGVSDPWGHPVRYLQTRGTFELRSAGPDGLMDTDDDYVMEGLDPLLRDIPPRPTDPFPIPR